MSNSGMITYTKLSPNHSGKRTHVIDTITIHHMAGNLTVEQCGNIFAPTSRQASSNYGVNGKNVGLYVDEANRAWTSSNRENDQRAVTLEVANDTSGVKNQTWTVSDETLETTIKLVADICKRNNIKKLVWSDNKNDRVNHLNGCNMTLHQDFAATACPGPYLKSKMSYIAENVNKILGGEELFNLNKPDTGLYKVQVGAYKVKANATAMEKKLKDAGYKTYMVQESGLWKVQTGAFREKKNADNLAAELKKKNFSVYVRYYK